MNITELTQKRYATKQFNPNKKISDADFAHIKAALRNSPSSVNIQPWHFVVADDEEGKARIVKAAQDFPFNIAKIADASHVVVFASRMHADDAFLNELLEKEDQDGRYALPEHKKGGDDARRTFLGIHRDTIKDEKEWLANQVHIGMGYALMAAAVLGIDSIPMEGVDLAVLDKEFGLTEKGYKALAVVSFGYHADEDFNAKLPKSRLAEAQIFTQA
ncbi:oxygen-insensitive NAD(P)H nitroreductase [Neisseria animalis]|uniref:Oxygen-insensitive NAD(P)H nitroreductase n=2 Tax=Neisseria animalis TaxID=492 RepID=A0A5P3MRG9_NEIAN|nr:oxygen-insensitive NAD(P)H nitroreductase [Neisseria animalis]ROW32608.1 oxygen-insensitive NAD(P)H nitroreductase [Neisseria animalis]VEE06139.1 oxidoreductase, NAD(P)H-flavin [Neisseria animalis]